MAVETATTINQLDAALPAFNDPKSEGDDHLRLIKSTVKNTFPNITGVVNTTQAQLNLLVGLTANAAELNVLDGITASTAELNILDGVTATTAELNILDGVTASTAELNLLDGVTATTAEINHLVGVTSPLQAQIDGKVGAVSPALTGTPTAPTAAPGTSTTQIATTAFVAATAFSSALPSQTGNAGRVITTNGSVASWQSAQGITQVISTNTNALNGYTYVATAALTLTLPATPAAGAWVRVQNSSGGTSVIVARNGSNIMSLAEDLTIDALHAPVVLIFADATRGWIFG